MKFNLTITDMNEEEFIRIFKQINQPLDTDIVIKKPEMSVSDIVLTDEPIEGDFEEPAVYEPAYDKNGLPWDARIHSSNHKLTDKGVWQRRRGVTDIEFERVKNELLGVQEPVATQPVIEPTAPVVAPAPLAVEPVAPVATQPVVEPVAQPTPDAAVLFQTMFEKIKQGMASGAFKANDVQALVATVNIQFGTNYQTLASVKDNVDVLQFIINDLTTRGL